MANTIRAVEWNNLTHHVFYKQGINRVQTGCKQGIKEFLNELSTSNEFVYKWD